MSPTTSVSSRLATSETRCGGRYDGDHRRMREAGAVAREVTEGSDMTMYRGRRLRPHNWRGNLALARSSMAGSSSKGLTLHSSCRSSTLRAATSCGASGPRSIVGNGSSPARPARPGVERALRTGVSPGERGRLAAGYTVDGDAYLLYLRGRYHSVRNHRNRNAASDRLLPAGDPDRSELRTSVCGHGGGVPRARDRGAGAVDGGLSEGACRGDPRS